MSLPGYSLRSFKPARPARKHFIVSVPATISWLIDYEPANLTEFVNDQLKFTAWSGECQVDTTGPAEIEEDR